MQQNERRHDLDWLRFIAILILLFFHTGMLFVPWNWHVKNTELSGSFTYWMIWLHEWRMPLLLFISGAGTYMALGKRTPGKYAGERFKRLVIPLIFGMFVIVPPQIYFEHITNFSSYGDFYNTVFEFVPYPAGSFSWHHLWFIAYLFLFSLIALPFLIFIRSQRSDQFKKRLSKPLSHPAGLLFIPVCIMLLTQIALRPFFPNETHALLNDWAFFTLYFCYFLFGMLLFSSPALWTAARDNRKRLLYATLIALIPFYIVFLHFRELVMLPWDAEILDVAFEVISIFVSWFTVITVIGYGQRYLNRPHRWLKHFNEGLYPFYILHQTVIIILGYYICKLPWSIGSKFLAVSLLTLIFCMAIYFTLIRPFNPIRILFGMKWESAAAKRDVLKVPVPESK